MTCSICSRTCTLRATGVPQTPPLTSALPSTPTPKRNALGPAISMAVLADKCVDYVPMIQGKRKKPCEPENDDFVSVVSRKEATGFAPGCGRLICRKCCLEMVEGIMCRDCN
ncbi:hypothetical protein BD626DRAFT_483164 [Schizophyllum amplum]|uniref:Uncharacterized protein n=1 Tax=Schizophyllum amplum TaxID=97359 RepID=A0A550CP58_9AGAR|nr:hypothetical protein BD626DRAFT_483164 [Auriculariopsis ampla]